MVGPLWVQAYEKYEFAPFSLRDSDYYERSSLLQHRAVK